MVVLRSVQLSVVGAAVLGRRVVDGAFGSAVTMGGSVKSINR